MGHFEQQSQANNLTNCCKQASQAMDADIQYAGTSHNAPRSDCMPEIIKQEQLTTT